MAEIPGINLDFLQEANISLLLRKIAIGFELVAILLAVGLVAWFVLLKPRKYKDVVEITDLETNQKYMDKGRLKKYRDGTESYILLKTKDAKMKVPPASVFITKRGKRIHQIVKYGAGAYNWASAKEVWSKDKKKLDSYEITELTDQNWNKQSIRRAAEVRHKEHPLLKFIPHITIIIGLVIIMIIMGWVVGVAKEAIAVGGTVLSRANEISAELATTASLIASSSSRSGGSEPPPDM